MKTIIIYNMHHNVAVKKKNGTIINSLQEEAISPDFSQINGR